jgi:hypothetical protein
MAITTQVSHKSQKIVVGSADWYRKQAEDIWERERAKLEKEDVFEPEELIWDEGGFSQKRIDVKPCLN